MGLFKKENNEMFKEQDLNKTDETAAPESCKTEPDVPMEGSEKKLKAMISQPMAGKPDGAIIEARKKAIAKLEEKGYEVVNTLFTDAWYDKEVMKARGVVQVPLCFLAKSLENMSRCHTAYFCDGWENARGCRIEHDVATAYGLDILYETEPEEKEDKEPENSITLTEEEFTSYQYKAIANYVDYVTKTMFGNEDAKSIENVASDRILFKLKETLSAKMAMKELEKLLFGQKE